MHRKPCSAYLCLPLPAPAALLKLLEQRERQAQVEPDMELHAWMAARVGEGMHGSVATELILRLLGLEVRLSIVGHRTHSKVDSERHFNV